MDNLKLEKYQQDLVDIIWITNTSRLGDVNSRIGIAEQISNNIQYIDVPDYYCTPELVLQKLTVDKSIDGSNPKWPRLIIGPSFHIPYMQLIKELSLNYTKVIALRPPVRGLPIKASPKEISNTDMIISYPYLDNSNLQNLFYCNLVPNRITKKYIQNKLNEQSMILQKSNNNIIGVLIGGTIGSDRKKFTHAIATKLMTTIYTIKNRENYSFVFISSPRTPDHVKKYIRTKLPSGSSFYDVIDVFTDNPYLELLNTADYFIVTADSLSMCSDIVSLGKPLFIYYDSNIAETTHRSVLNFLLKEKLAKRLTKNQILHSYSYVPLSSSSIITKHIINTIF